MFNFIQDLCMGFGPRQEDELVDRAFGVAGGAMKALFGTNQGEKGRHRFKRLPIINLKPRKLHATVYHNAEEAGVEWPGS